MSKYGVCFYFDEDLSSQEKHTDSTGIDVSVSMKHSRRDYGYQEKSGYTYESAIARFFCLFKKQPVSLEIHLGNCGRSKAVKRIKRRVLSYLEFRENQETSKRQDAIIRQSLINKRYQKRSSQPRR